MFQPRAASNVVRRKTKAMAMTQRIARGATKIARAVVDGVEGNEGSRGILAGILKRGLAAEAGDLKKTVLHDFHVEHGAKMVPFAGWSMPIQYKDSIMESTQWCRSNASLFDVAHMCGLSLKGKDAIAFLEKLVVGDVKSLKPGTGTLSVFTNENGGIIDDSVITKVNDDHIYLVVNAGCREKDLAHIEKHLKAFQTQGGDVDMHVHDERSLLALQGPEAANILQKYVKEDLGSMYFSDFKMIDVDGAPCWVTRTGYTGEDGFELSIPDENTLQIAKAFLSSDKVRLTGLGARDSLRLEAGLCLYGNDLEEHISPVEAGLTWTIGKSRREKCDFLGGETIKKHLTEGVPQRRVGLVTEKGAPPRSHAQIALADGTVVGEVTSGAFSPNLKKNVAMGYVEKAYAKAGTKLAVLVRGKSNDAVVTKMPFVPAKYYKP